MDKISIIIPVYNVENYIEKCLDSIINQTYRNLEIICIDDGSVDKSGEICDKYAKNDSRFKVIHTENKGYSSAINLGLDNFTGEYVSFVDPDDWIEINYYEKIYDLIKCNCAEIACTGFYKDTIEKCTVMKNKISIKNGKLVRNEILRCVFIRDTYPAFGAFLWNKLFKSVFFKKKEEDGYEIRLDTNIKVCPDVLAFTECVLRTNNAIYSEKPYYHYFQRDTSLFHSKDFDIKKGSLEAYNKIIKIVEENDIDNDIVVWIKRFYVYHASLLADLCLKNNDIKNLNFMQNEIKRYLKEYIETNSEYPERIERINSLLEIKF